MSVQIKDKPAVAELNDDDSILVQSSGGVTKRITFGNLAKQAKFIVNDIGKAGGTGFGVGIAPQLPAYIEPLPGTFVKGSDEYGNYRVTTDGSIMVWVPKFYYKITNDTNAPYYGNKVEIKAEQDFADEAAANAAGYALHRAFVDGGSVKRGFFIDKYSWSLTNFVNGSAGIASSIKNSNPISSASTTKRDGSNNYAGSFSNCISNSQAPADIYGGAWSAAKSRGNDYAVATMFQHSAIGLLELAHAQASTSAVNCAWYDATNVKNFPKGNNLTGMDCNDNAVTFAACDDGYWAGRNEARKTGSGSNFAKTTHNGQNCGISDLNGNQYTIYQGLTCIAAEKAITAISKAAQAVFTVSSHGYTTGDLIFVDGDGGSEYNSLLQQGFFNIEVIDANTFKLKIRSTSASDGTYINTASVVATYASGLVSRKGTFYVLKESASAKAITGGVGGANDHFGNATLFDVVDLSAVLVDKYTSQGFGNGTNQVFNMATSRADNNYKLTVLGLPGSKTALGGTNQFGNDWFYKYIRDGLCPLAGGYWSNGSPAGAWILYLYCYRGDSYSYVSGRSCLYV